MTDEELRKLLNRMKNGDLSAFEEIYNGLSAPVYTIALRITQSRTLAEDTVQEVFLKLYSAPPAEHIEKLRAYIFRMAHNRALDMLRAQHEHEDIDDIAELAAPQREDHSDVTEALSSLSEAERSIISLHIYGGLKFREIAEITGSPTGTVLWRYNRAISRLRKLLSDSES